jgi:hypothetical protein
MNHIFQIKSNLLMNYNNQIFTNSLVTILLKRVILIFIVIFMMCSIFAQESTYHVVCVDSIQVPYDYNASVQNNDGSITFYKIQIITGQVNFNKFSLSPSLVFSDMETFYSDQLNSASFKCFSHQFGNDYFTIESAEGKRLYVFNNDQIVFSLTKDSEFLPINTNCIIYSSSLAYYKIDIHTDIIDSLIISPMLETNGFLPINNQQFMVKYNESMYISRILAINNDLTISDTIFVNESVDPNILNQIIFDPSHAIVTEHGSYLLVITPNIFFNYALIVINEQNEILYALNEWGYPFDLIDRDQNHMLFLYSYGDNHDLYYMQLSFEDYIHDEPIPIDAVPIRQFAYSDSLIVTISNYLGYRIGVTNLLSFPDFTYTALNEEYYIENWYLHYWKWTGFSFLIDFYSNLNHYIKKFNIIENTSNQDFVITQKSSLQCYPNPCKSILNIQYQSDRNDKQVSIEIYNIKGQLVRKYLQDKESTIVWDGTDSFNRKVTSGIYIVSLKANNESRRNRKILFLK